MTSTKKDYLYRIMSYQHTIQLFTQKKLYFSHPSRWEDPYETRVKHSWEHKIYAQCWCKKSMSDAMWRIYSQQFTSLRIKTTREKLEAAMDRFVSRNRRYGYKFRIQDVEYLSTQSLIKKTQEYAKKIANPDNQLMAASNAANILCQKRNAFDHEQEVRALIYRPEENTGNPTLSLQIDIDPHELIESILIDPRAPDELFDAFKYHLKNVIGFQGIIQKSALYKVPEIITTEPEEDLEL